MAGNANVYFLAGFFKNLESLIAIDFLEYFGRKTNKVTKNGSNFFQKLTKNWLNSFNFFQLLKFSVFNWRKNTRDAFEQESLGSMECSLAEILSAKARFERGIIPYRQSLGDMGMMAVYAEEHTGK